MERQVRRRDTEDRAGPAQELSRRIAALATRAREMGAVIAAEGTGSARAIQRIARAQIELERAVARILEAERA